MKRLEYCDFYTVDEFCELLDSGFINECDGYGTYSIGEDDSDEPVSFSSDLVRKTVSVKGYTGVLWSNK